MEDTDSVPLHRQATSQGGKVTPETKCPLPVTTMQHLEVARINRKPSRRWRGSGPNPTQQQYPGKGRCVEIGQGFIPADLGEDSTSHDHVRVISHDQETGGSGQVSTRVVGRLPAAV